MIEGSEALAFRGPLLGRHVDRPGVGPIDGELVISGWALSAEGPLEAVLVLAGGRRVARVRADRPRPDIAQAFPDCDHAAASGFRAMIPAEVARHLGELEIAIQRHGEIDEPIWRLRLAQGDTALHAEQPVPSPRRGRRKEAAPAPVSRTLPPILADSFRVVALIAAYNEADMIEPVLEHLWQSGIWSYLIDDGSSDETVARARRWLGRGLLGIEQTARQRGARTSWRAILARKLELAAELGADWYIHHDADEVRESPWPGVSLRDAIQSVDRLGYNAIDFRVLSFPPVDDTFRPGDDPRAHFVRWEEPAEYDRMQRKCWKAGLADVSLEDGGHDVRFEGRRLFPVRFLLRHYPVRSQAHGRRKVWRERKSRFAAEEVAYGWHRQYDHVTDRNHLFLRSPACLRAFDLDEVRLETVLEDGRRTEPDSSLAPLPVVAWGFLESVGAETISGWAAREDGGPLTVALWDAGRMFATARADRPRADLARDGIGGGGFVVRTPRDLLDGRPHWIWATIEGTGAALRRSPIVLHHGGRLSIAPPEAAA